jgi:hypothetical protein
VGRSGKLIPADWWSYPPVIMLGLELSGTRAIRPSPAIPDFYQTTSVADGFRSLFITVLSIVPWLPCLPHSAWRVAGKAAKPRYFWRHVIWQRLSTINLRFSATEAVACSGSAIGRWQLALPPIEIIAVVANGRCSLDPSRPSGPTTPPDLPEKAQNVRGRGCP